MSIEDVLDAFERKERGIPQAHMAAELVVELRRSLAAVSEQLAHPQAVGYMLRGEAVWEPNRKPQIDIINEYHRLLVAEWEKAYGRPCAVALPNDAEKVALVGLVRAVEKYLASLSTSGRIAELEKALAQEVEDRKIAIDACGNMVARAEAAEAKLNAPELHSFRDAVVLEAAHQRERWGTEHDQGKEAEDWMWLVAYLATKATQANRYGDPEKYLHHIITCAAACANWHANATGANTAMRPGVTAEAVSARQRGNDG